MDPNGTLTSSPKYDVYGLVRSNSGTASSKMGFVGGLGHLSEANTGLIYMRARYYDPNNGRFSSQDPSQNGSNWFVYCGDDPVNEVDANGKEGSAVNYWIRIIADTLGVIGAFVAFVCLALLIPGAVGGIFVAVLAVGEVSVTVGLALYAAANFIIAAAATIAALGALAVLIGIAGVELADVLDHMDSDDKGSTPSDAPSEPQPSPGLQYS